MAPDGQAWSTAGSTSAAAAGASTTGRGVTLRNDLPDSGTPLRVGGGEVEGVDAVQSLLEERGGGVAFSFGVGFAAGDGGAAEGFDGGVEGVAGLLAEDFAEEHAEGADIAAKGRFLEVAGGGLEFGEALGPVGRSPEGRHAMIMPCAGVVRRAGGSFSVPACGGRI